MKPYAAKILLETDLCVLCTSKNDVPDASLMLYICDDQCTKLYMLTLKDTDKYRNILHNPNVSVLVDTRDAAGGGAAWTKALTIHGEASVVSDSGASGELIERMVSRHGQLMNLANDGSVAVIQVQMKRILFLNSVDEGFDVTL